MRRKAGIALYIILFFCLCVAPHNGRADSFPIHNSANMMGTVGLNLIPSARMDDEGTLRASIARAGPYTHSVMGLQLTDRLYLGVRQTADAKSLWSDANTLTPGVDAKLRLFREKSFRPEISVGLQSALGRNTMAAQYLAMSKRWGAFDMTGGFGWGRMGTRQELMNPVLLHNASNTHWFQGSMGVFGGIEYNATPDLSLKADWTSEDNKAETRNRSAPWALGFSYHPFSWLDTGLAWNTGSDIMARISVTPNLFDWPIGNASKPNDIPLKGDRPKMGHQVIAFHTLGLSNIHTEGTTISADLNIDDDYPTPDDIGRAARQLANIAGPKPEQIAFRIHAHDLRGPDIILNRKDIERATLSHQGSSEEIWANTSLGYELIPPAPQSTFQPFRKLRFDLVNDVSLSENDAGIIGRSALIASETSHDFTHFFTTWALRINLVNNLGNLNKYRSLSYWPVREDIDAFTQNRFLIERYAYTALGTLSKDLHIAASTGYLEEMYFGTSGEILYRPFASGWAMGIETALAMKRSPYASMGLGLNGDKILTGHINGYYEVPDSNITLHGSMGRYLAGDVGGSVDITNHLTSGVQLSAMTSITNKTDTDYINGGHTNVYAGLSVSLPFGGLPLIKNGSRMIWNAAPLGRNTAQRLKLPMPLYEATEPLSYRHITQHWSQLMPSY